MSSQQPHRHAGRRNTADVVAGGIVFTFAILYSAAALTIPDGQFGSVVIGPKTLPLAIGFALAASGVMLAVRGLFGNRYEAKTTLAAVEEDSPQDPSRLGVVVGLLLMYVVLFLPLGYVASTFLFILSTTMFLDRDHPVRNLAYALIFPVVVYIVFTRILGVVLPPGPLGI